MHVPPVQLSVSAGSHTWPQVPQFAMSPAVFFSQPLLMAVSQFVYPLMHTIEQAKPDPDTTQFEVEM